MGWEHTHNKMTLSKFIFSSKAKMNLHVIFKTVKGSTLLQGWMVNENKL